MKKIQLSFFSTFSYRFHEKFPHSEALVALPFPKRKGEVGCKALSSSIHELWQENSLNTEHAETPRDKHAEKASDKQRTGAKMFQTAASARKIIAECCKQHSISRVPRSFDTTSQQLATRLARAHATRPQRSIEFYAAAGKFAFMTRNPCNKCFLEHQIHIFRNLSETTKIIYTLTS